jgi:hypothetical protein
MARKGDEDEGPNLSLVGEPEDKTPVKRSQRQARRQEEMKAKRLEATSLRLAGLTWEQIGDRLGMSDQGARSLVETNLERANQREVDMLRAIENQRLDKAMSAIWRDVLSGDLKAIDTFLKISQRRSRLNGLDAPQKIDMNLNIRQEMEQALNNLESMVLGQVVNGEVVWDDRDSDADPH